MGTCNLDEAVALFGKREGVVNLDSIGRWPACDRFYPFSDVISAWAMMKGLTGVVWTALPPSMRSRRGVRPSLDQIVAYLARLSTLIGAAAPPSSRVKQ